MKLLVDRVLEEEARGKVPGLPGVEAPSGISLLEGLATPENAQEISLSVSI